MSLSLSERTSNVFDLDRAQETFKHEVSTTTNSLEQHAIFVLDDELARKQPSYVRLSARLDQFRAVGIDPDFIAAIKATVVDPYFSFSFEAAQGKYDGDKSDTFCAHIANILMALEAVARSDSQGAVSQLMLAEHREHKLPPLTEESIQKGSHRLVETLFSKTICAYAKGYIEHRNRVTSDESSSVSVTNKENRQHKLALQSLLKFFDGTPLAVSPRTEVFLVAAKLVDGPQEFGDPLALLRFKDKIKLFEELVLRRDCSADGFTEHETHALKIISDSAHSTHLLFLESQANDFADVAAQRLTPPFLQFASIIFENARTSFSRVSPRLAHTITLWGSFYVLLAQLGSADRIHTYERITLVGEKLAGVLEERCTSPDKTPAIRKLWSGVIGQLNGRWEYLEWDAPVLAGDSVHRGARKVTKRQLSFFTPRMPKPVWRKLEITSTASPACPQENMLASLSKRS